MIAQDHTQIRRKRSSLYTEYLQYTFLAQAAGVFLTDLGLSKSWLILDSISSVVNAGGGIGNVWFNLTVEAFGVGPAVLAPNPPVEASQSWLISFIIVPLLDPLLGVR